MTALVVGRKFSERSKMKNEQEKDLEKAEQELFEIIISIILYLNKNGIRLDAVREMIQMKVEDAFAQYLLRYNDYQWKNRTWQDDEDP